MTGAGGLVVVAVLTRYLGASLFGSYTFVTGYVSLFYVVTDLGVNAIFVREMAVHPEDRSALAGELLSLRSGLVTLAVLSCLGAAFFLPLAPFAVPGVHIAITAAALALLWNPMYAVGSALFQTTLRMQYSALADTVTRLGGLSFLGIVILLLPAPPGSPLRLVAASAMSTVGLFIGALVVYLGVRRLVALRPQYHGARMSRLLRDAAPLAVVTVLGSVHYRIDVVILSSMTNMATVGAYGIATKSVDASLSMAGLFLGVVFPVLSSRRGQYDLLRRAFGKSLEFMLILSVGAAVFISSFATSAVRILGGTHFHAAAAPVAVIAWAIPVLYMSAIFSQMVVAANKQYQALIPALVAIVVNVVLNVLLIPHLGATAPAAVTVISESLSALGIYLVMVRHYGFGVNIPAVARILLAAAFTLLAIHLTSPLGFVLSGISGVIVYCVTLILFRAVTAEDVRVLISPQISPS